MNLDIFLPGWIGVDAHVLRDLFSPFCIPPRMRLIRLYNKISSPLTNC